MVPVQRKTRTQGRKRRSQDRVARRQVVNCPNCSEYKLPHAACMSCGYVRAGLQLKLVAEDED